MKLIIAYIQPERLTAVKQALYEREIFRISVTNALGCGQQKGYHETYRGVDTEVNLLKKIRLEIAVNDEFVEATVAGIIAGARTNKIGDGKIFIQELNECIRIRTGERGGDAIGPKMRTDNERHSGTPIRAEKAASDPGEADQMPLDNRSDSEA